MATIQIDRLLETVVRQKASDLHLAVGRPPCLRLHGGIRELQTKPLDSEDTMALMKSITPERIQQEFEETGSGDFGFAYGEAARFRVSIFKQKGVASLVLRRALRQDPDVMLVGEMRDLETIQSAITAAETGHLVFGTLHTSGAASTINRIIDAFPTDQQEQVRVQLSGNLIAVLSQCLCPRVDTDGMLAAYEFMFVTPGIQNLIREGKSFRIDSEIQTGKKFGMQLLDDNLWMNFTAGKISKDEAIEKSRIPSAMVDRMGKEGWISGEEADEFGADAEGGEDV